MALPAQAAGYAHLRTILQRVALVLLFLALWQFAASTVPGYLFPSPIETWEAFLRIWQDGSIGLQLGITMYRVTVGFMIAAVVGVPLGILLGSSKTIGEFFSPVLPVMNSVSSAIWSLIAVVWFGLSNMTPIFVCLMTGLPLIVTNVWQGTRNVNAEWLELARSVRMPAYKVFWKIYIPAILPFFFSGARLAFGFGARVESGRRGAGRVGGSRIHDRAFRRPAANEQRRRRRWPAGLRGRDERHRGRAAAGGGGVAGVIVSLGGQTPLKLAGLLPPELVLGTPAASIDLAEDRDRWNDAVRPPRDPAAGGRHGHDHRGRPRDQRPHRLSGARAARATCSAAGPWRSSTTTSTCDRAMDELAGLRHPRRGGRTVRRAPGARRPLPRGRHRGRRRRHPRPHRRGRHRRGDGARRGGRRALGRLAPASIPPYSLSAETIAVHRGPHPRASPTRSTSRGLINVQYAVKQRPGLRDRGQPPRQPHGAVRGQGHRRAAGEGGGPGDGRRHARRAARRGAARAAASTGDHVAVKEAVLPVQPLPRRRRACSARRCARPAR